MIEELNIDRYLEGKDTKIILFPENIEKNFTTMKQLKDFIDLEVRFWTNYTNGKTNSIRSHFINISNYFNNFINNSNNEHNANNYLNTVFNNLRINRFPLVFSDTDMAKSIVEQYDINPIRADAVIEYFFESTLRNITNRNYFEGVLEAYKYRNKEIAFTIVDEGKEEKFLDIKQKIFNTHDELSSLTKEYKLNLNDSYNNFSNDINEWSNNTKRSLEDFIGEKTNKFNDLETTYNEKLKLEAPSKYWDELHNYYNDKGKLWTWCAIISSFIIMALLLGVLYNIPNELKVSISSLNLESLRATLLLTIVISIGIYLIRLFVKLALSSYHLSRDAKERYQLTYVYLALIKDKSISEEDRNIVLQALFSRADTGLLKGDSSPTLPDGMLQQLTKLITK